MRRALLRQLIAVPLALWVAGVLAVPGLDGCPMHGLRAPHPSTGAAAVPHDDAADMVEHAQHVASPDHDAPAPDSRHQCDCPGDCSASVDLVVAPSAPTLFVSVARSSESPRPPQRAFAPASHDATRQPPSIGPPRA